jgi:hypothetical protein
VVVTVKDGCHAVVHEKLMDRLAPTGPFDVKTERTVRIVAAPLVVGRGLDPAAPLRIQPSHEVMDENEPNLRVPING